MCDALSRNIPKELQTILANCLAHGRRYFVDVVEHFRDECRYVLEALEVIYKNDAEARKQQLSPEARLLFHQAHSGPIMDELHEWLNRQFDERLVEPNSGLGEAISYMLNHWKKLTLFLRKAGAPLDNNVCGTCVEKDYPPSQELLLLSDAKWCSRRRSLHEPDLHVRAQRGQSVRLPHRTGTPRGGAGFPPRAMDALELPGHIAAHRQYPHQLDIDLCRLSDRAPCASTCPLTMLVRAAPTA